MVDTNKSYTLSNDGISIEKEDGTDGVHIGGGDAVPTYSAPIGSFYLRSNGVSYKQKGPSLTAWVVDDTDLSNYETTTQLNVRDTNNRARANHTGTQLASTISDFEVAHDSLPSDNPHAVTKGQVGLGNVDNTSDANKPVSTAQAAANTTDRARANHTGTQLASTVSDFQSSVTNNAQVLANTAKVTNATHTGEVTGSGALTLDKTSITNKTLVTAESGDFVLVSDTSDTGNLKKVNVSDFGGKSITEDFTQASHGFAVGNAIRFDTTWVKALADTGHNSEVIGIVSKVTDVNNFTVTYSGRITGLSGLTPNTVYFLSGVTAGALVSTTPTISKPVLFATSATSAVVSIMRALNSTAATTNVFGTQYYYNESEADSINSTTTYNTKVTLVTPSLPLGDYRIGYNFTPGVGTNAVVCDYEVRRNSTQFDMSSFEADSDRHEFGGFKRFQSISGIQTIDIRFRSGSAGANALIRTARIEIWRVG